MHTPGWFDKWQEEEWGPVKQILNNHVPHMKTDIAWLKVLNGAMFAAILTLIGLVLAR